MIHCRTRNGVFVYRVWSDVVGSYLTDEMSLDELVQYLRAEAITRALDEFERDFPRRLQRAQKVGTSSHLGGMWDLHGPWVVEAS